MFRLEDPAKERFVAELLRGTQIGDLPPKKAHILGTIDLQNAVIKNHAVQIEARNGTFHQQVRLCRVNGDWKFATQVSTMPGDKQLYNWIDDGFPLNSRGEVDWSFDLAR